MNSFNKSKQLSAAQLGIAPLKTYKYLTALPAGYRRFIVTKVVQNREASLLLMIKESQFWFPKRLVKFGYHPSGLSFAVDVPDEIVQDKKL